MSKIIVLAGSPRKNGNTDMPAEAFARGVGKRLLAEIEQYYSGKRLMPNWNLFLWRNEIMKFILNAASCVP